MVLIVSWWILFGDVYGGARRKCAEEPRGRTGGEGEESRRLVAWFYIPAAGLL